MFICSTFSKYLLWKNVGKEEDVHKVCPTQPDKWAKRMKSNIFWRLRPEFPEQSKLHNCIFTESESFDFSMILKWDFRAWNGEKIIPKTQKRVACKSQGWQQCWSLSLINSVRYSENLCLKDKHGALNSDCRCLECYSSTFYKAVSSICTIMILFILALTQFLTHASSTLNVRTSLFKLMSLRCVRWLLCSLKKM